MPRKILSIAVGTLVSATLRAGAAEPSAPARVTVVEEGKSPYAIVVPDDADAARLAQAANLLQSCIERAAGAKLPVVKESELKPLTPALYLGKSRAARKAGLPVDEVKEWAYRNKTVAPDIFLVGDDGAADLKGARPVEHLGTLKAVAAFLEDQAGVRFFLPGTNGTYVPRLGRLAVDAAMDRAWRPRFDYVTGRAPRDRVLAVANNFFGAQPVLYTYGGHSYYDAVPEKDYGATHPEYFALIGGVRQPKGNHLCVANPEVQELMLKEMEKRLDLGYQWVELAQTDGYQACGCPPCAAIHPDPGERTWIVHRKLAEEMRKRRPGKKVMILAYPPTTNPPKTFNRFPDNVVIQMCAYSPEFFEAWAPFHVDKTVYIYNWGQYLVPGYGPKRTPLYAVEQIRMFLKNGVRGIYICGGLDGGQGSYGLEGPSYYAFGKALADPDRDPDELLREYADAAFGEAAVPMREFFRAMHERLETYGVFDRPNTPGPHPPSTFRSPEEFYCHIFSPKLLDVMSASLKRAGGLAASDCVKANLRLVEAEFAYVRNLAGIFHVYRAYRAAPDQVLLGALGAQVAGRKALLDSLFPGGQPLPIDGLPSPFMGAARGDVEAGGRLGAVLGAPLNWDFALLRERGVLPGVGARTLTVTPAADITVDGRLDEPAWGQAAAEEMTEINMGAQKNATRFKVVRDADSVYLGFVCAFDRIEPIEALAAVGRDGAVWKQENIEIMIDPYGQREKHCQFALNPVPDSTYDARHAYIEDPLHPLYGKRDGSWNGEWQYAAAIDREGKQWTAEVRIPFATLGVEPPGPGTTWTMNVGRTEFPQGYEKGPVYSTWAPNLEARSFHDRTTFGEAVFK